MNFSINRDYVTAGVEAHVSIGSNAKENIQKQQNYIRCVSQIFFWLNLSNSKLELEQDFAPITLSRPFE